MSWWERKPERGSGLKVVQGALALSCRAWVTCEHVAVPRRCRVRPRPSAASRVCKQATSVSVLSEWPSTEVPSVPRRLRPDPNTVLNFVVKARMNIRANQIDKTVPGF